MKVLDLFCGAGGFSYGFHQEGFNTVAGVDIDAKCREPFEANHPDATFVCGDLKQLEPDDLKHWKPDIIIGSPPCIHFSSINPHKDGDAILVDRFFHFVDALKPRYFVLENVPEAGPSVAGLRNGVRRGNSVHATVLNALDFGSGSKRNRLFYGNFPVPMPTHTMNPLQSRLDGTQLLPWRVLEDSLELGINWGYLRPDVVTMLRGVKTRKDWNVPFPDASYQVARCVLASCHKMNQNTFVIQDRGGFRLLTVREHARLQGFPDSFRWFGGYYDIISQIGNAVPPPLSQAIARAIKKEAAQ